MARALSIGKLRPAPGVRPARRRAPHAPRFVVRVLAASFLTVVVVLVAVLTVLGLQTRDVVERNIADDLDAAQRQLAASERDRQQDAVLRATLISINRTLKRVLEATRKSAPSASIRGDAPSSGHAAARDRSGRAAAALRRHGRRRPRWPGHRQRRSRARATGRRASSCCGPSSSTPSSPDDRAHSGPGLSRHRRADRARRHPPRPPDRGAGARRAVRRRARRRRPFGRRHRMVDGQLVATTAAAAARRRARGAAAPGDDPQRGVEVGTERHAYRLVQRVGPAAIYAVASITAARDRVTAAMLPRLIGIVAGGLLLCLVASIWLARRVAAPIDRVSTDITKMIDAHAAVSRRRAGRSRSRSSTRSAPRSTDAAADACTTPGPRPSAAYVGAIRALAAALDARDPYTAGHSERVSLLSVAIGPRDGPGPRRPRRAAPRRAAARHRQDRHQRRHPAQAGPLTADEFEAIKRHTVARRADPPAGRLPRRRTCRSSSCTTSGPTAAAIRTACAATRSRSCARIVHVADAFDAMTTARAYRAARPAAEALAELWRHAGTDFDLPSLQALVSVLPRLLASPDATVSPRSAAVGDRRPRPVVPPRPPPSRKPRPCHAGCSAGYTRPMTALGRQAGGGHRGRAGGR